MKCGSTAIGVNPSHIYSVNGNYTVTLTVNDGSQDLALVTTSWEHSDNASLPYVNFANFLDSENGQPVPGNYLYALLQDTV